MILHEMMSWLAVAVTPSTAPTPTAPSAENGGSGVVVTILGILLGLAVTVALGVVTPRLLGQLVPVSKVDDARREGETRTAAAVAEAATWHKAFDGMKEAHDGLLTIQRESQQAAVISNAVMSALRAQLPPGTSTPSHFPPVVTGGP